MIIPILLAAAVATAPAPTVAQIQAQLAQAQTQIRQDAVMLADVKAERDELLVVHAQLEVAAEDAVAKAKAEAAPTPNK